MRVSCICPTVQDRFGLLQRSIQSFINQTYPDKELIICVNDQGYANYVRACITRSAKATQEATGFVLPPIRVMQRMTRTAQEGYYHALTLARGDLIAFWDDDNNDLPDRLEMQVEQQKKYPQHATAFSQAFYYFYDSNELFVVDHDVPNVPAIDRCVSSTLMIPRDELPWLGPSLRRHPSSLLVQQLQKQGGHLMMIGGTIAHLVGVRGDNLRGYETHRQIAVRQPGCWNTARIRSQWTEIKTLLEGFCWDRSLGQVDVIGADGRFDTPFIPTRFWPASFQAIGSEPGVTKVVEPTAGGQ